MQLEAINNLTRAGFTERFGPLFEHSPWIAEATWSQRPFASVEALYRAFCDTVRSSSPSRQITLIQAHPDLVGRAALAGTLTPASAREQASAGLEGLTAEEIRAFQDYNQQYRDKFGFPFVICARLNKKQAILEAFPRRLQNTRPAEIATALEEIYKIAYLRLQDILAR